MDFSFTQDQEALRASAREVVADKAGPVAYRKAMEGKKGTDEGFWRTIGELGWMGLAIDESHGGLGLGLVELCILSEEMGRGIVAAPFFSTVGLAAQVAAQTEPSPGRDAFLARVAAGETRATLALGQKDGRADASGITVKAVPAENGWTLSGKVALAPEAHLADEILIVARTERARDPEQGVTLFLMPSSSLKSKPKPRPSMDGARRLADIRLSGVAVNRDAALGSVGGAWPALARGLDRAAVVLAAEAVGVATEVLERSVAYAKERQQFGKAIGSFQAVSHRCADMLAVTESARSHVYYAAWALEEGTPDASLAAASAKAAAAEAASVVANGGIQVHGGIGFTWEHEMHLFYRRAKWCELFLGDASFWRERIAAQLAS